MQKWQFAHIWIPDEGNGKQLVYQVDGRGVVEVILLSENGYERNNDIESLFAKVGLRGWELAAVDRDSFYFKRPIE